MLPRFLFDRIKITTIAGENIYGRIHSYSPHTLLTVIATPPTSSPPSSDMSSGDGKYTKNATFIAIKVQYVKSIQALEKDKPRGKAHTNEKFGSKINAPTFIPTDTLGSNIRRGSKEMTKQEIEFKLRRMTKGKKLTDEGKKVLRNLAAIFPIDTLSVDDSSNIMFQDSDIKIMKPYKSSDVKVIGGDGGANEQQQLAYIRKVVDREWEKMEQNQKGG